MIAGPDGVYICNECVELCRDILGETLQAPSPGQDERAIRLDRRTVLSARLRALESWTEINEAVRACQDRQEAVDRLVAAPFNFSSLEAQVVLDMGMWHQTAAALSRLRQEIAELSDTRDG